MLLFSLILFHEQVFNEGCRGDRKMSCLITQAMVLFSVECALSCKWFLIFQKVGCKYGWLIKIHQNWFAKEVASSR